MSENVIVPSRYLTAVEVADRLGISLESVCGLVKCRRIFPLPGRLLFTRESLDRFLAGKPRKADIPTLEA
jgi:hypothetical protein